MTRGKLLFFAFYLLAATALGQNTSDQQPSSTAQPQAATPQVVTGDTSSAAVAQSTLSNDQAVDRVIEREHALIAFLRNRRPIIETYLQELVPDSKLGAVPGRDHYFLGRLDMSASIKRSDYLHVKEALLGGLLKPFRVQYHPLGFSWMIFADRESFDRAHYDFHYVRREFLGEIRCLVFDVEPKPNSGKGRFKGRIWVEDQDYNLVRMNGTYVPRPKHGYFFHMDSWRLNLTPGYWVPAYVYNEEGDFSVDSRDKITFKAQSRIWGYNLGTNRREEEFTDLKVDAVKDSSAIAQDATPVEAERQWQQQAEDNVLERLQKAGLLAPPGEVDKVLQTVVNNIEITNNIDLPRPVRTRVMLTTPLETFSVGNTIVISRGLVDTLPDEACLAAILAHELGHIVLGHNVSSQFAFSDRMLFSDDSVYHNLGFRHNQEEETAADAKAIELLKNSPYGQKLSSPGLYLKQLAERSPALSGLLTAHLGNSFVDEKGQLIRLAALVGSAPALDDNKLDQIAALPLGTRIRLDPWSSHIEMLKTPSVSLISAREKKPFGIAPFFPRLTRFEANPTPSNAASNAQNTGTSDPR